MSFVLASSSSVSSQTSSIASSSSEGGNVGSSLFSNSFSESCFFSDDHPSDQLRKVFIEKGLIDCDGNATPLLIEANPMQLDEAIVSRVRNFFMKSRELNVTDGTGVIYQIQYSLKEFSKYMENTFERSEIIGGKSLRLLGTAYFTAYLEMFGVSEPERFLSKEFKGIFETVANDEDVRFFYPGCSWDEMNDLGDYAINFFVSKISKKYGFYISDPLFNMVRGCAFNKLFHFSSNKLNTYSDSGLHYLTLSPKDSYKTELCLIAEMPREHLFIHDALGIDFTALARSSGHIFLKSDLSTSNIAIVHRLLGIVDADHVEKINHFGWPIYISLLCRGKICIKDEIESSLTCNFVKTAFDAHERPFLLNIITKVFNNHLGSSSICSISLYILNALLVARKHLSKEDFERFRSMLVGCISLNSEPTLYPYLDRLLKSQSLSFELLAAFVELFVLNIYMDENVVEGNIISVMMRSHCRKAALQMTLYDGLNNNLLLPLNSFAALKTISENLENIDESDLETLSHLYAILKRVRSQTHQGNRLGKYVSQLGLDISQLHFFSWDLFTKVSPFLKPFVHDLIHSLSSLEVEPSHLHYFLGQLPTLLNSCESTEDRNTLYCALRKLFVRFSMASPINELEALFIDLEGSPADMNTAFLERIALYVCRAGRKKYHNRAFNLFRSSQSRRLKEFVEGLMPDGITVAFKAIKWSWKESKVCLTDIADVCSNFTTDILLSPDQIKELSEVLIGLFRVNDHTINRQLISFALRFLQNNDVRNNLLLSDQVLSIAHKEVLSEGDQALFLQLLHSYFECFLQKNDPDRLQRLMKNYGNGELRGDVRMRCHLKIISNRLLSSEMFKNELLDQFSALLQMEEWHTQKLEIITCFELIIKKTQIDHCAANQRAWRNNLLYKLLSDTALAEFFSFIPHLVISPILYLFRESSKSIQDERAKTLLAIFLRSVVDPQILLDKKIEYTDALIDYLGFCLPKGGEKSFLAEYVDEIFSLIQLVDRPDLMIRFLLLCDTHSVLLHDEAGKLDQCLWSFEREGNSANLRSYAKIMQRLMKDSNTAIMHRDVRYERFLTALFCNSNFTFDFQTSIFWIRSLIGYGLPVEVSFDKIFLMINELFNTNRVKEAKQIVQLFAEEYRGEINEYSIFWRRLMLECQIDGTVLFYIFKRYPINKVNDEAKRALIDTIVRSYVELVKSEPSALMELLLIYNINDPKIWCEVLEIISQGNHREAKKQLWPLLDGELQELGVFDSDLQLKERAYLAAARCLKYNDSEISSSLLSHYLLIGDYTITKELTEKFRCEFFCGLAMSVIKGVKTPLNDENALKLLAIFEHKIKLSKLSSEAINFTVELDILFIDQFASCKHTKCYDRLWSFFGDLLGNSATEDKVLVGLYCKLINQIPFQILDSTKGFYSLFLSFTKIMVDRCSPNFNYPLLFDVLQKISDEWAGGHAACVILGHIDESIKCGIDINLHPFAKILEKYFYSLISVVNFKNVGYLLNLSFVNNILNKKVLQSKPIASSSNSRKSRRNLKNKEKAQFTFLTPLKKLRLKLMEEMLSHLIVSNESTISHENVNILIDVIAYIPHIINTNREIDYFAWLLQVLFAMTDKSGDFKNFRDRVDDIFKVLILYLFSTNHLILNDYLIKQDEQKSVITHDNNEKMIPQSSSSSSLSQPGSSSDSSEIPDISFEYYLRKFSNKLKGSEFEESKKIYSTWILFFFDKLIIYETKSSNYNLNVQNVGYQTLDYFHTHFHVHCSEFTMFKYCMLYFTMNRAFVNEVSYDLHRKYCTRLIEKYKAKVNFWNRGEDSYKLIMIDPKYSLRFKKDLLFFEQIEKIIVKLSEIGTDTSLRISLEILSLNFIDLFNIDSNRVLIMINCNILKLNLFFIDSHGQYALDRMINIFSPKGIAITDPKFPSLVKMQQEFLSTILSKEIYEIMEQPVLMTHFEAVLRFFMKRFQTGSFTFDLSEFERVLSEIVQFVHYLQRKDDGNLIPLMKVKLNSFINFCSLKFPENGDSHYFFLQHFIGFLQKLYIPK